MGMMPSEGETTDRMRRPAIVVNSPVVFITILQTSMILEVEIVSSYPVLSTLLTAKKIQKLFI